MGFTFEQSISALAVFAQGLLSFFSPCVLPLVPVYLSYLAGGSAAQQASPAARRRKLLVDTFFFVVGISFAFFALGLGVSALGQFFSGHRLTLARIGGGVLILLGLVQLGVFGKFTLSREFRLPVRFTGAATPLAALVLGFTFSFAWTPCVGPALASVLLLAGTAETSSVGFLYIGLYTLGFVLPFLALGLFADVLLGFIRRSKKALAVTARLGAALLVCIGLLMLFGWTGGDTSSPTPPPASSSSAPGSAPRPTPAPQAPSSRPEIPAPDFTLTDQYGNEHTLSDYKGKIVFLNFWADWCTYCVKEMPDIEQLYQDTGLNGDELVILGVTDGLTHDEMAEFFAQRSLTYPTLLDTDDSVFAQYGISSLPTTFMIDVNGNVYGYLNGMMTREMMESIIEQTRSVAAE